MEKNYINYALGITLVLAVVALSHDRSLTPLVAFGQSEVVSCGDIHVASMPPVHQPVVIAQVALEGEIVDSSQLVEKFTELGNDDAVHAVILKVNSPGGALTSSEILHHELGLLEQKKPVVALLENECCSGAYWTASAATYIVAPKTAVVGSIGTVEFIKKRNNSNDSDTYVEILHAGEHKVFRSCDTPALTDEQRAMVQRELDFSYEVFCSDVAAKRGLDLACHKEWADGKIFVAELAPHGMIDQIGYPSDALAKAHELAQERFNIIGQAQVVPMWRCA